MAIRNILRDNDPSLKKKSRVVTDFDNRLHQLLDDMRETLIDANGLGLAAPQVGVLRRVALIVDLNIEAQLPEEQIIELVNPEITASSGEQSGSEGCLSVPGIYGIVTRPDLVKVKAQDRHGNTFEVWCKDITARAAFHEIDHLDGVLFTTHVERFLTQEEMAAMNADDDDEDGAP
ncbi:MAG: peptide deformylase [Oscillospiraceae bacterium]|nr:peptide deformylase [Oscillospiraceae bacterium]